MSNQEKKNNVDFDGSMYTFLCPHCENMVQVSKTQLNCKIFRHGIFKHNLKQINPHMKKELCDFLKQKDLIYGCGKPFKLVSKNKKLYVEKCGYI